MFIAIVPCVTVHLFEVCKSLKMTITGNYRYNLSTRMLVTSKLLMCCIPKFSNSRKHLVHHVEWHKHYTLSNTDDLTTIFMLTVFFE